MIEGSLIARGWELHSVQVVLGDSPSAEFYLQDVEGRFLTVEEVEKVPADMAHAEHNSERSESESGGLEGELETLRAELEASKAENADLQQQLEWEKTRVCDMWWTNFQCLAQYDEMMAQQEAKLCGLKGLLSSGSPSHGPVETAPREGPASTVRRARQRMAPPVDSFTGETGG